MGECSLCQGTGTKTEFVTGIGPYDATKCGCQEKCNDCKGIGEGKISFARGIGPYPTTCTHCKGRGTVPK